MMTRAELRLFAIAKVLAVTLIVASVLLLILDVLTMLLA